MNIDLFELLDKVGWNQAPSEYGAQVRSDLDQNGAIRTDVLAWDGARLLLDTESIDTEGNRRLVSAAWHVSENSIAFANGVVDEKPVFFEDILRARAERTHDMERPDFHPSKSSVPAPRTPSGRLAL